MPGVLTRTHVAATMVKRSPLRLAIALENPVASKLGGFAEANSRLRCPSVEPDLFVGQTLALCGAGPSLRDEKLGRADKVWACNSALPYLLALGAPVDAAVGIDQTPGLLREWSSVPDVTYYVASTCDPELVAHLLEHGRRVVFFHNHVGFEGEREHYWSNAWPPSFMVGEGATVVSRVIGLAQWMGFERVDIYGADCAFGPDDIAHANGEHAEEAYHHPLIMQGEVGGRTWRTRPDMLMGAVDLARRVQKANGRIRLIGDTLPVALLGKDEAYLTAVMRRLEPGEIPGDTD